MRVLVVGKGARDHALAWKVAQSPLLTKLFVWPGNPLMKQLGEVLDAPADQDYRGIAKLARELGIDLVISGPEDPLANGLADYLALESIPVFGPSRACARLESSKRFAKEVMSVAKIPTADYDIAQDESACRRLAKEFLRNRGAVVLKADGLAAGKGVFVCEVEEDLEVACDRLYRSPMRTAASDVIVEERLLGRECSYFTFLGARGQVPLGFAVDFKRLQDGDRGPNTGGMGCYSPVPWLAKDADVTVVAEIVDPLIRELGRRDLAYVGCLYVGIMWTKTGPRVVEFNVRLGDPEAQILAVQDTSDWLAIMAAQAGHDVVLGARGGGVAGCSVGVVMASQGYPYGENEGEPKVIPRSFFKDDPHIFGAAVERHGDDYITGKGRVLTVAARAESFAAARAKAYGRVEEIKWQGCRYRQDIAAKLG